MRDIVGWALYGVISILAISFTSGIRLYAKTGQKFSWPTALQTLFWWILLILFLIFKWNKLHILWLVPLAFFFSQFIFVGNVPILSSLLLSITKKFIGLILVGLSDPENSNFTMFKINPEKITLIKKLVEKRFQKKNIYGVLEKIDSLTESQFMGLPEATLLTIVESWIFLKNKGIADEEIFKRIEAHRVKFGEKGNLPNLLNLQNYIKYRLNLEHGDALGINEEFIIFAINSSKQFFLE